MKNFTLLTGLFLATLFTQQANAQLGVRLSVGFGNRSTVYENSRFYYLPDIDAYYDIAAGQYVYFDGNDWIYAAYLPEMYNGFDFNSCAKISVNEVRPYLRNDFYRNRYASYRDPRYSRFYDRGGFHQPAFDRRLDEHNRAFADRQAFDQRGSRTAIADTRTAHGWNDNVARSEDNKFNRGNESRFNEQHSVQAPQEHNRVAPAAPAQHNGFAPGAPAQHNGGNTGGQPSHNNNGQRSSSGTWLRG